MELPQYITPDEVKRVCKELGIRDWTELTAAAVLPEEAVVIQNQISGEAANISSDEFRKGLEVELEHGVRFKDANVTNNHPLLTGKIVLAHLKESLDYYIRLDVAELEGDLVKATAAGNAAKIKQVYQKLENARQAVAAAELKRLS